MLKVCLNVDGLPLSESQLWPIMMNLTVNKNLVEILGVYQDYEKPKYAIDFLAKFVEEAILIVNNGFYHNGKKYVVEIVCDAPTKSFIKCTRGHSGYMSCTKCDTEGNFINNKICFSASSTKSSYRYNLIGKFAWYWYDKKLPIRLYASFMSWSCKKNHFEYVAYW